MLGNLVNLLVWLLVAAWIVASGWEEPLKYRFMTTEARNAEEKIITPPLPPTPPPPDYRNWGTPGRKAPPTLGNPTLGGHGLSSTPHR